MEDCWLYRNRDTALANSHCSPDVRDGYCLICLSGVGNSEMKRAVVRFVVPVMPRYVDIWKSAEQIGVRDDVHASRDSVLLVTMGG